MTAPAPSPAEQAVIDRFGIFEPEERVVEEVAQAIFDAANPITEVVPAYWQRVVGGEMTRDAYRKQAAAAVAAYRAAQDGGAEEAVRRVEALCDAADDQPDGYECQFIATHVLRAALAPQADR